MSIYDDGHILVDDTRFVIGNKTIPINAIVSIEATRSSDRIIGKKIVSEGIKGKTDYKSLIIISIILIITVGFWFFLLNDFWNDDKNYCFELPFYAAFTLIPTVIVGIIVSFILGYPLEHLLPKSWEGTPDFKPKYEDILAPTEYTIWIKTSAGSSSIYTSENEYKIDLIVDAINTAIIRRG
jgi:hypothetical protein